MAIGAALALSRVIPAKQDPKQLTVNVVKAAHIEDSVLASGIVQPSKLVSVGAQASGRIMALHVSLGDQVTKGQLIAEIDPSTQHNALQIAEATLDQELAQRRSRAAASTQAELAFKRAQVTYPQDASALADYEAAQAAYEGVRADVAALDAQIRQATIAVDTARVNLGYTKVTAPIDGTVVAILAPEGQTVNAVQAVPTIVKVADLKTMTVKVQISEVDVMRVRPGQNVYFSVLGAPQKRYEARLRTVEPAPESMGTDTLSAAGGASYGATTSSSAVYYDGLFEIANADQQLRPFMTAQVNIVVRQAEGALVIPATALGESLPDGRRVIQVMDTEGRIRSRPVQIGISDRVTVQVLDGVAAGERVVSADDAKVP